jgi:hypothetical protein
MNSFAEPAELEKQALSALNQEGFQIFERYDLSYSMTLT